ncbi:MAG TPA: acetyltransferase [Chthoniobacterales bacterium]|nr:acetyltransferase [Chthoniobacterales bacterium]
MKRVAIIGAGGHAKVVISTLRAAGFQVTLVVDDDPAKHGAALLGIPVIGPTSALAQGDFDGCVIAVGQNRTRRSIASKLRESWITAIHPEAIIDDSVTVAVGTVIFAGAVIQPDTVVGEHAIVNTGATIDHDCVIGDFAHIAPGVQLAGDVQVGAGTLLGIGTVAIPGIRIGKDATVGAGSVLVRDVPDGAIVYGNPGKSRRST